MSKRMLRMLALFTPLVLLVALLVFSNTAMTQEPGWSEVTGQVKFPDGNPVGLDDAYVEAISWMDTNMRYGMYTDENGDFFFDVPQWDGYDLQAWPDGPLAWEFTPSIPQGLDVQDAPLYETGPLTFTYPSVAGPVFDPHGNVFGDCLEVWLSLDPEGAEEVMHYPYCGYDGDKYLLGGVEAGSYWLHAWIDPNFGFDVPNPQEVVVEPDSQYDIDATQWITIQLGMGADITPQLEVEVFAPSGNAVPGRVHVWDEHGMADEWRASTPEEPARFAGLPPADYQVQAWPMGRDIPHLANSEKIWVWVDEMTEGKHFGLDLRRPDVVGTVEAPGGHPLPPAYDWEGRRTPPAMVKMHDMAWTFELMGPTNITGEFGLAMPVAPPPRSPDMPDELLPEDEFALMAVPRESLIERFTKSMPHIFTRGDIPNAGPYDAGFVWLTFPSVKGVVVGSDGRLFSASVDVRNDDWSYQDYDETHVRVEDQSITLIKPFSFGGMPAGEYFVQSSPPYEEPGLGPSAAEAFIVEPGSQYLVTATHWITLEVGVMAANVTGTVEFPDGRPVPWADVCLMWPDPDDPNITFEQCVPSAEGDGTFAFFDLEMDIEYLLEARPPWDLRMNWAPSEFVTFTLTPDDDFFTPPGPLVLRPVERFKHVRGRVTYENGGPVNDAWVVAQNEDTWDIAKTKTDDQGQYDLGLDVGVWRLWVEPRVWGVEDWYFPPEREDWVEFAPPPELEEIIEPVDFAVIPYDLGDRFEVTGMVYEPDGSSPAPDETWVELCNDFDGCFGGPTVNGTFKFRAPAGFYFLGVWPDPGFLPPVENGEEIEVRGGPEPQEIGPYTLRKREIARVSGQVIEAGTNKGVKGIMIEAWTEEGDFASTKTVTDGLYTLELSPGYWRGGPVLTPEQERVYAILPPQRREGELTLAGAHDQDFRLSQLNATIRGQLVDVESNEVITDVDAVVFVETETDRGHVGTDVRTTNGRFSVRVIGGMTYTLDVDAVGYMAGPDVPKDVYVAREDTADTSLSLREAGTQIHGNLEDRVTGQQITDVNAFVYGYALVSDYSGDPADTGIFEVGTPIWPGKAVEGKSGGFYSYTLDIPTPDVGTVVTWTFDVWVDPREGYIADPASPPVVKNIDHDNLEWNVDLNVKKLDSLITGAVRRPNGEGVPNLWVFAETATITGTEGFEFEAKTDASGMFTIPVLPDNEYLVGAFIPPKLRKNFLPPIPKPWASNADNPVPLRLRRVPTGTDEITIQGGLTVSPTGALTTGTPVKVIGYTTDGSSEEVTGTIGGAYTMRVISSTVWHMWAVAKGDRDASGYAPVYVGREIIVKVGDQSVSGQDIVLTESPYPLAPKNCWTVGSWAKTLVLPGTKGKLPEPTLRIYNGTFSGTVEICAEPVASLPDGQRLIGFGYELTARDSKRRPLGADDFRQKMRLSFNYTADALESLPIASGYQAPQPSNLTPVYFSTLKNEWIPLDDPMVNEVDRFVSGRMDHFTSFGLMGTTPSTETAAGYSVYLPLVLRQ